MLPGYYDKALRAVHLIIALDDQGLFRSNVEFLEDAESFASLIRGLPFLATKTTTPRRWRFIASLDDLS